MCLVSVPRGMSVLPLRSWSKLCTWSRPYSTEPLQGNQIADILAKPSWSVRSLLVNDYDSQPLEKITQKQLHHLLRLSALPLPTTAEEEGNMIKTLESQLHFVQAIQSVDTTGVEPLQSVRDETQEARHEHTITLDSLKEDLEKEVSIGHLRRIRRRNNVIAKQQDNEWDPLALVSKKIGRYIVVETGKR